ncbi:744_t:CDS:2, partial [Scutellospora calospora]
MSERYIPEHRRTQFKARNQFKPDELRRRREEQQVEIRKQKREENLAKRRGIQTSDGGIGVGGGMAGATESDDEASAIESETPIALLSGHFDPPFVFMMRSSTWEFFSPP